MFDFIFGFIGTIFMTTFMLGAFALVVLFLVFHCIGRMRMFEKAGAEAWAAWVPFYSDYVMCKVTMRHGYYFLFGYIPVIGFIANIVYAIEISISYGQGYVFAVLYYFFPWICDIILGFGKAPYLGAQDVEEQARRLFSYGKKGE